MNTGKGAGVVLAPSVYPKEGVMLQMSLEEPKQDTMPVMSIDDLEDMPQPDWLLENKLPEGQTWVYGEPGVGKTFVVLDWAATVAAKGNNVLYFVGEGVKGVIYKI